MKTLQTCFGEVQYDPERVVHFPEGLLGLEQLRDFVVMPNQQNEVLFCLQSVEESHIAFLLINPALFFPDYQVDLSPKTLQMIGISESDPYFILTTITFHQDKQVTLNLLAPVVYSPKTDRAVQIVLDGSGYRAKTPLPPESFSP